MKQRCLFLEAAVVCRSHVSCQPNHKYSSAKLSLNSVLSLSNVIGTSTQLSSNNVHSSLKVIRTSARLSSTITHLHLYPLGVAPRRVRLQSCITRQGQGRCRVLHCSSSALEENKNLVLEAYSFEGGNYKVLSSKHLLKTVNQVPDGEWYNTLIPSSTSSLVLRPSFHSRLFWKWRYTGSAATWLLESQIYYNNHGNGDVLVVGTEI